MVSAQYFTPKGIYKDKEYISIYKENYYNFKIVLILFGKVRLLFSVSFSLFNFVAVMICIYICISKKITCQLTNYKQT